uniref:DRBM domain-containing protein n=1 Tax=Graphocephala atropunctata TaxID=36148 RepID=A0A1B6MEM6_9HEMI
MAVFLRENGELAMGNKTPVTILQELLQKKGLVPQYELIYNGTGTLDPVFKFSVSAEKRSAIGHGKTKKQAKHDAAAALLKRMLNVAGPVVENGAAIEAEIVSPYDRAVQTNFVGKLEEICCVNKIPYPVYDLVGEEGPPHARIFTIKCQISTISETVTARTKKQAKHLVAKQMIGRVAEIIGERFLSEGLPVNPEEEEEAISPEEQNRRAIESGTFRHIKSTWIADLQHVFHHRPDEYPLSPTFLELPQQPERFYRRMDAPGEFLTALLKSLGGVSRVLQPTPEELHQCLVEADKYLSRYQEPSEDEEDDQGEEESTNSEPDEDSESGKLSDQGGLVSTYQPLQDFDLGDTEYVVIRDIEASTSQSHESPSKGTTEREVSDELNDLNLEDYSGNKLLMGKPILVVLAIECPQGQWSFHGCGNSSEEAEAKASVRAILFLRQMSFPIATTTATL